MLYKPAVFILLLFLSSSRLWAQLNVYYIDVGQGDATYIELPNGRNVLIDGGPSGAPIEKFMKEKGIIAIDYLVLTHPHNDHYRGLKTAFALADVKNFYDTRMENIEARGDNNLRELADAEPACATHFPEIGEMLNWDPAVKVKVLNSCTVPMQARDNSTINNCSIVLHLVYNGTGLMFSGDAEAEVEAVLLANYKADLPSYALKVPHHGSRFSSTAEYLAAVQPKVAIFSFGVNNTYGHPHLEAVTRVRATGARIFYTTDGTQTLSLPPTKAAGAAVIKGPVLYVPPVAGTLTVVDVVYTPEVQAPRSVASEALGQLEKAAAMVERP